MKKEIITTCPFCDKDNIVKVEEKEFLDWQSGTLIQYAMPKLSPQERELLISGICSNCWIN